MSYFVFNWVLLSVWFVSPVCKMNVHIRCKGNVAPNCGVNSVELANKLAEMGLQAGGLSKRNSVVQRLSLPDILLKRGFNQADLSGVFLFVFFFVFFLYWQAKSAGQVRAPSVRRESTESQLQTIRLGISDFTFLQVLGKGSFGKVGMTREDNEECSV